MPLTILRFRHQFIVVSLTFALALFSSGAEVLSTFLGNIALVRYIELLRNDYYQWHYLQNRTRDPLLIDVVEKDTDLSQVVDWLQLAQQIVPSSPSLLWTLGRVLSAMGDVDAAATSMERILPWTTGHALAQPYAMFYASINQHDQVVIDLANRAPRVSRLAIDSGAVAMQRMSLSPDQSEHDRLEQILQWQPTNLNALLRMYELSPSDELRESLRQFGIDAVNTLHPIAITQVISALRRMAELEIITPETVENILRYYVWRLPTNDDVAEWVINWVERENAQPSDLLLLAELYERRDDASEALDIYAKLLAEPLAANSAVVQMIRLCLDKNACSADILNESGRHLRSAATRDYVASQLLTELCSSPIVLDLPDLQESLCTSDVLIESLDSIPLATGLLTLSAAPTRSKHQIVADLLGTPEHNVFFSNDLLINGDFRDGLRNWAQASVLGNSYTEGAFEVGLDSRETIHGSPSLRIDGLWVDTQQGKSVGNLGIQATDRAGMFNRFALPPNTCVLVEGLYKTLSSSEIPLLLLVRGSLNIALPATDGRWLRANLFYCNQSEQTEQAEFSIRLRSAGQLWLDDWSIQLVDVSAADAQRQSFYRATS
jgi:hypothetical protein